MIPHDSRDSSNQQIILQQAVHARLDASLVCMDQRALSLADIRETWALEVRWSHVVFQPTHCGAVPIFVVLDRKRQLAQNVPEAQR